MYKKFFYDLWSFGNFCCESYYFYESFKSSTNYHDLIPVNKNFNIINFPVKQLKMPQI